MAGRPRWAASGWRADLHLNPPCRVAMGRWQRRQPLTEGPTPSGVAGPFGPSTTRCASGPPPHGLRPQGGFPMSATGRNRTDRRARPKYGRHPNKFGSAQIRYFPDHAAIGDPAEGESIRPGTFIGGAARGFGFAPLVCISPIGGVPRNPDAPCRRKARPKPGPTAGQCPDRGGKLPFATSYCAARIARWDTTSMHWSARMKP